MEMHDAECALLLSMHFDRAVEYGIRVVEHVSLAVEQVFATLLLSMSS
jgi:hypothetical protein